VPSMFVGRLMDTSATTSQLCWYSCSHYSNVVQRNTILAFAEIYKYKILNLYCFLFLFI